MMQSTMLERYRCRRHYSVERLGRLYSELIEICLAGTQSVHPRFRVEINSNKSVNHDLFLWISKRNIKLFRRILDEVNCNEAEQVSMQRKRRSLSNTFLSLAATRSTLAQYNNSQCVPSVYDYFATEEEAMNYCLDLEKQLVDVIRSIGELVVNAERLPQNLKQHDNAQYLSSDSLRSDEVFEYFCDKSILTWLVDIVKSAPLENNLNSDNNSCPNKDSSRGVLIGVTWSPQVKAQVFQSVSLLVSGVRDESALFYILSQHCVNQLIVSVLPLQQFTTSALETMMPAYVHFLKTLAFQLSANPDLIFPLCSLQDKNHNDSFLFPLFSSIIAVLRSNYAKSDSYVHASCLNLTVGLMRISHPSIRHWIAFYAENDQKQLADHVSNIFIEAYLRIVNVTTGPVVDVLRSKAIETQLEGFQHLIDALNDLFFCDVQIINIRLCESLLSKFIRRLLNDLLPDKNRQFFIVGEYDSDVIPYGEAAGQIATLLLSNMIGSIKYGPFVRMMVVAVVHPNSSNLFTADNGVYEACKNQQDGEYCFTLALSNIIQSSSNESEMHANPYRGEVLKAVGGAYGTWRVTTACCLLDSVLNCCHLDFPTLMKLELIICSKEEESCVENDTMAKASARLESSLIQFLKRNHVQTSLITAAALESVSGLCILYLQRLAEGFCIEGQQKSPCHLGETIMHALMATRSFFYRKSMQPYQMSHMSHSLVEIADDIVRSMYKSYTAKNQDFVIRGFSYQLKCCNSAQSNAKREYLVRKNCDLNLNDDECTRFFVQMAFHFRAVCNIVDAYRSELYNLMSIKNSQETDETDFSLPSLRLIDSSAVLSKHFYSLQPKPVIGTEININECMTFQFSTAFRQTKDNRRNAARDFVLVLNMSDMFVVAPVPNKLYRKGTIVCCVPYFNIIAAATDGSHCLHIAIRNEDVHAEPFMKNGNFMFHFDTPGTCHVVKQYFDRSRTTVRQELFDNVKKLFACESSEQSLVPDSSVDTLKHNTE